ncbi:hypothetical protein LNKW23_02510 [Paralimibaculum aggregatum]|uniref:Secreted protein n=1 Tax=Paralimibaculum aggregatum TaxID=3036245 RepID=A0ABQ6LG90_9RHOB|nr:hypothetical protein [Limibaculum sp. NKW23]GMG81039.1 hypothetical protein LNKW23_02510 [Limibaculum sp. NKW23]
MDRHGEPRRAGPWRIVAIAAALGLAAPPAAAAVVSYDVGTIAFGVPPVIAGVSTGAGTLTGSFDFDDVAMTVTAVDFTVSGTVSGSGTADGALDGSYDVLGTVGPFGDITAFRSSDGATPVGIVGMDLGDLIGPFAMPADGVTIGLTSVGGCLDDPGGLGGLGGPCALVAQYNLSSAAVASLQPGLGTVPLPASWLALCGALGLLAGAARRPAGAQ